MPRASSQSSKAMKSGFGLQEGIVKVTEARFKIEQHSKKDGTLVTPFFGMLFDYVKCDESGEAENSDDIMTKDLPIQWVAKDKENKTDDGEPIYLFEKLKFRPGNAKNATDTDPEDLGCEVGTEGNTMYAESDGLAPFQDADWIEFCKSLEQKGFKPEINDQSYAPNYVGLVFKFHTENKPLRKDAKADDKPQTKWVVDQIYVRPYEAKGGKAKPAASSAAKPNGKAATTAKTQPAPAAESDAEPTDTPVVSDEATTAFTTALEKLVNNPAPATKAVSNGLKVGASLPNFQRAIANEMMLTKVNGKPIAGAVQKEVISAMRLAGTDDEPGWIETAGAGVISVDREKGEVTTV